MHLTFTSCIADNRINIGAQLDSIVHVSIASGNNHKLSQRKPPHCRINGLCWPMARSRTP